MKSHATTWHPTHRATHPLLQETGSMMRRDASNINGCQRTVTIVVSLRHMQPTASSPGRSGTESHNDTVVSQTPMAGTTQLPLKSALRDRTWRTSHVATAQALTPGSVFPAATSRTPDMRALPTDAPYTPHILRGVDQLELHGTQGHHVPAHLRQLRHNHQTQAPFPNQWRQVPKALFHSATGIRPA